MTSRRCVLRILAVALASGGHATSIRGTVMVSDWYIPSAPVFTCSWHVGLVLFESTSHWSSWGVHDWSSAEAFRHDFVLSPDCPFTGGSSFLPAPVPGGNGLRAWDRTSGGYVETLRSWYVGSPVLLSQSTVGTHYASQVHRASWTMAPFMEGGTFVMRLTPPAARGTRPPSRSVPP